MDPGPGTSEGIFFTAGRTATRGTGPPRGELVIAGCRSGGLLSSMVLKRYRELARKAGEKHEIRYMGNIDFQFSDGETCVRLPEDVSGADVFLFQALYDPLSGRSVDQNYMAFLIAAKTFRSWGAGHVTAVLPYLAYSRQDKPTWSTREPSTARLMADLCSTSGADRLVTWHPHTDQTRGFYGNITVDKLDPLGIFAGEFRRFRQRDDVIAVAPDAGASKMVTYFGRELGLKCAIASKYRPEPEKAAVSEIIGDFRGKKTAIVLDDMISSGDTVHQLITKLAAEKKVGEVYLAVSHNLCSQSALGKLIELHESFNLKEVVVTDTIPQSHDFRALKFLSVRSVSDTFSRVINRIHYNQSVNDLFYAT
ncbi:MAG: ribose-phosphate diphosphokinase [Candidatus Sulfobium sp.]|jgi:ribose-phosphate pyrophosphokinase